MAQEMNEELGRVLRERGVIGDALDNVERKTRVKREQLVYGAEEEYTDLTSTRFWEGLWVRLSQEGL
ncbi:hypothetical protein HPB52_003394 [Rhipicephalus sanguineus]|uniref:Uncharacterized protein n=1 Tax=Rhipicephalus sanguineus TaxID=34632 RepID=A0A9D4QGR1_RHISA|nr:hypothetical protein HPB52_003394 [Rhipicephalus sanguineus]